MVCRNKLMREVVCWHDFIILGPYFTVFGVKSCVREELNNMSRRGENIFQRKDGLWEARYVKGVDEYGKKKYGSIYAHTYREAKEKRVEVVGKLSAIPQHTSKRMITLTALVDEWLYVNKSRIKASTYQKYDNFYRNHIINQIGQYQVIYINPVLIKQFTDSKLKSGLSESTVNSILVFIHTCMKYGSRQYGLPVSEIVYIKNQTREMRVLSICEQKKLTNYLINDIDIYKFAILVALYTGVRIGELCALKWKDVNNGVISINKTMQRLKGNTTNKTELVIGEPKSSSSIRVIPIPIFIVEYVELFRKDNEANFLSRLYHPLIEPRVLQYQFKKHLKECDITDASFHALRHTFATRCVESNMDIKTLSELLGHSNVTITLNKYVHSSFQHKQASMNKLKLIV